VSPSNSLRDNNFDLLRVLFAVIVFFVHAYVLSENDLLAPFSIFLSSEIAVKSFFVVSGFLIFMSYENSRSLKSYTSKRIHRIYPAYFSIVVLCALLGVFISSVSVSDYFSIDWLKYLLANLLFLNFLHPELPGVFSGNIIHAVDGALWTLKIEVMFYLSVPVLVWSMRKWGRWQMLLALYIASLAYVVLIEVWGIRTGSGIYLELQRQFPGQLMFFIAGAVLYYYLDLFKQHWLWLLTLAVLIMVIRHLVPVLWLEPIALAIIVIYFACVFPWLGNFGKYGDFSYGIYIVHFPILQVLIAEGMFESSPMMALSFAAFLVLACAYLFWHYIEKPFLRSSSHYVEVNRD